MGLNWDPESPDNKSPTSGNGKGANTSAHPVMGSASHAVKKGKQEGPETVKNVEVGSVSVEGKPALVGFAAGLTLKLGNFEMARVDVRIERPCTATDEGIAHAYDYCKTWVTERLQTEVDEIRTKQSG